MNSPHAKFRLRGSAVAVLLLLGLPACHDNAPAVIPDPQPPGPDNPATPATPDPAAERQTRSLFDGHSLEPWQIIDFGGQDQIVVADGAIMAEPGWPLAGIRRADPEVPRDDYSILLEACKLEGTDFFCCLTFPVGWQSCSLVIGGWGGVVTGISCIDGEDAAVNRTRSVRKYEPGTWYPVRVDVSLQRVICHVDGEVVAEFNPGDVELSVRNEVLPSQPLGICAFETRAAWRNIRLVQPALDHEPTAGEGK